MQSVSTWFSDSEVCKSCTVSKRQYCSHGETFCGWHCAQTGETCSSTRIRRDTKSVIESQKRADVWERIWRSDEGNGLSKYLRWGEWLRKNTEETISRRTDSSSRTPRTSPLSHCPSHCPCIACTLIIHVVLRFGRESWKVFFFEVSGINMQRVLFFACCEAPSGF